MGVAIFSHARSIDYKKIGGLESLYRRIADELLRDGHDVEFVLYGARDQSSLKAESGVTLRYFKTYTEAVAYLRHSRLDIVSNYIKKRHRLHFLIFRAFWRREVTFFRIITGIEDGSKKKNAFGLTWIRRLSRMFETPIVVSNSVYRQLLDQGVQATLCTPPVPKQFYISEERATADRNLEVTFVGRFDENKGIPKLLEVFENLSKEPLINLNLSGYFGHGVSAHKLVNKFLTCHPNVWFSELSWDGWSKQVDLDLIDLLRKTDVLILPYKNMKGTMDPPYLVLEGMATRCVVITTDLGSINDFLCDSSQVLTDLDFVQSATQTIRTLLNDRDLLWRIQIRNQDLMKQRTQRNQTRIASEWSMALCQQEKLSS